MPCLQVRIQCRHVRWRALMLLQSEHLTVDSWTRPRVPRTGRLDGGHYGWCEHADALPSTHGKQLIPEIDPITYLVASYRLLLLAETQNLEFLRRQPEFEPQAAARGSSDDAVRSTSAAEPSASRDRPHQQKDTYLGGATRTRTSDARAAVARTTHTSSAASPRSPDGEILSRCATPPQQHHSSREHVMTAQHAGQERAARRRARRYLRGNRIAHREGRA